MGNARFGTQVQEVLRCKRSASPLTLSGRRLCLRLVEPAHTGVIAEATIGLVHFAGDLRKEPVHREAEVPARGLGHSERRNGSGLSRFRTCSWRSPPAMGLTGESSIGPLTGVRRLVRRKARVSEWKLASAFTITWRSDHASDAQHAVPEQPGAVHRTSEQTPGSSDRSRPTTPSPPPPIRETSAAAPAGRRAGRRWLRAR